MVTTMASQKDRAERRLVCCQLLQLLQRESAAAAAVANGDGNHGDNDDEDQYAAPVMNCRWLTLSHSRVTTMTSTTDCCCHGDV